MTNQENIYNAHCNLVEQLCSRAHEAAKLDVKDQTAAGIVKDAVNAYAVAVDKLATFHSPWVVAPGCEVSTLKERLES